jgi:hypothetical protein
LEAAYFDRQVNVVTNPSAGVTPEVQLQFKNTGRSRAKVHLAKSSMLIANNEQEAFARMEQLVSTKSPTSAEINPDGKLTAPVRLGHGIDSAEYSSLLRGDLGLYVVGELDYEDTFGAKHVRVACDRFDFENQAWVGCATGNETR